MKHHRPWYLFGGMKGQWFYEWQIVMFVIMWKHDLSFILRDPSGITWGRLHVWTDSAWYYHGLAGKIRDFFRYLMGNKKMNNVDLLRRIGFIIVITSMVIFLSFDFIITFLVHR